MPAPKDGEDVPKARLFVRGLPYDTTNQELEALFSDIGPTKECFVIKDKESSAPKGYAFVKFSMKDDAIAAKTKLHNSLYKGRRMHITFAQPKHKKGENEEGVYDEDKALEEELGTKTKHTPEASQSKHKPKPPSQRAAPATDNGRKVVVRNIPPTAGKAQLKKKFTKYGKVESVEYEEGETLTATVTYESYEAARKAEAKLTGVDVAGTKLNAIVKSRDKPPSKKSLLKSRLIIRNLSFKATEAEVRSAFEPHGHLLEVKMVTGPDGKQKGFCFVQYRNVFDAGKALEALNGTKLVGRPIAVDWAVPKKEFEEAKPPADDSTGAEKETKTEKMKSKKTKKQKGGSEESENEEGSEQEEEESEGEEGEGEGEEGSEGGESEGEGSEGEGEEERESEDESEGEEEDTLVKKSAAKAQVKKPERKADVEEGKTIFIRNVAFDTTEEDLRQKLEQYGELHYVKLVVDSETKRPKGTAFAKFKERESAEACVEEAAQAVVVGKGTIGEGGVSLNGRTLNISVAVDRNKAVQLKEEHLKAKEKQDSRNLFLAWEGHIKPGTPAAEGVSAEDMKKREKSMMEKRRKLKLPTFMISKHRLVVKNIPAHVDEAQLKEIFTKGAVDAGHKASSLKKVILMRNRDDPKRIGRSLGWAFVEFNEHEPALAALRATNNNPEYFSPNKRLIVEFTVENTEAIRLQEKRRLQQSHHSDEEGEQGKRKKKKMTFNEIKMLKIAERKKKQSEREQQEGGGEKRPADDSNPSAPPPAKKAKTENKKTGKQNDGAQKGKKVQQKPPQKQQKPAVGKKFDAAVQKGNQQADKKNKGQGAKAVNAGQEKGSNKKPMPAPFKEGKAPKGGKKDSRGAEDKKLDSIVDQYRQKLFGGQGAGTGLKTNRWFE